MRPARARAREERLDGARADDDDVVGVLEVAEPATLDGSARGIGDGVEPEDEVTPPVVCECMRFTLMVLHGEVRRGASNLKHVHLQTRGSAYGAWCALTSPWSDGAMRSETLERRPWETEGARGGVVVMDPPLRVNDDPDSLGAPASPRSPGCSVGEAHGPVHVAQKREVEREAIMKALIGLWAIEADAQDHGVFCLELLS